MTRMRIIGGLMFLYGAGTLALLATPARGWALDHSIAELVSWSDRRVANEVTGSVDTPLAVAGSAVLMFAGAWFGLFIPAMFGRARAAMPVMSPVPQVQPTAAQQAHPSWPGHSS